MLAAALAAAGPVASAAGGGPSSASQQYRDITGPTIGARPMKTEHLAIAALALLALAGLGVAAYKASRKG